MTVPFKIVARDDIPFAIRLTDAEQLAPYVKRAQVVLDNVESITQGAPGPADNTYITLAAFKASDRLRRTASLVGIPGVSDGRFNWTLGDYTGQADDTNIIKADSTALSVGAWVRQGAQSIVFYPDGGLAQPRPVKDKLAEQYISVADKMTPAQVAAWKAGQDTYAAENWLSVQTCINEAKAAGGGTVFFPIVGPLWVDQPIEGESYVRLKGCSMAAIIRKKGNVPSNVTGVDCIINFGGAARESGVEDITVVGDRVVTGVDSGGRPIVSGSQHGFNIQFATYVDLLRTKADYCLEGYRFSVGNGARVQQAIALRCESWGFNLFGAQTTTTLINCTAWGCGGGYRLSGAPYNALINPAADNISVGGRPGSLGGDPFGDAGGYYLDPSWIFFLEGALGTTIISPGTEGSSAQWLHCEGATGSILSPNVTTLNACSPGWTFAEVRGIGRNAIDIVNPHGFADVENSTGGTGRAFVIETPATQSIDLSGRWRLPNFDGPGAYPANGINARNSTKVFDYNQRSMVPGAPTAFLKADPSDIAAVSVSGSTKILTIDAVSAQEVDFWVPIDAGMYLFKANGSYSSDFNSARMQIVETNGTTSNVLKTWSNDGGTIAVAEWYYAPPPTSGYSLRFRIRTSSTTDTMNFSRLELTYVPGQA